MVKKNEMKRYWVLSLILVAVLRLAAQQDNRTVVEKPVIDWGTIPFEQLKNEPIWGTIKDENTLVNLDLNNFDITVEVENDFLYDRPRLHIDGEKFILDIHPRGDWCECLFPKNLNIRICSTQKEGAYDAEGLHYQTTVHPIHITVAKNRAWVPRCLWVMITIVGLLLLFIYLRAMSRKHRFKRNASITPVYYDRYGIEVDDGAGQRLRKRGFVAWFARWFIPVDERNTLSFDNPEVTSMPFVASESSEVVTIPKGSLDPETMEVDGYDPENDMHPEQPVKLANNSVVNIYNYARVNQGYLRFSSNNERDGGGYRVFLTVLMLASLAVIIGLIYMMIKSFM